MALLVALYRLYETRPDTFNIPSLLLLLKADNALEEGTLNQLETLCCNAKPLWLKVNILRNKVFGHRSISFNIEDAFKAAKLTPNNIRDLIEQTKQLLDAVSHASSVDTSDTRKDLIQLLTDIKRADAT